MEIIEEDLKQVLKLIVGRPVKCINDAFSQHPDLPYQLKEISLPKKGEKYEVRGAILTPHGKVAVLLQEVRNRDFMHIHPATKEETGMHEPAFLLSRFEFV